MSKGNTEKGKTQSDISLKSRRLPYGLNSRCLLGTPYREFAMAANRQDTVSSLLNEAIRLLSNDTNDTNQAQLNRESSSHSQRVAENFR